MLVRFVAQLVALLLLVGWAAPTTDITSSDSSLMPVIGMGVSAAPRLYTYAPGGQRRLSETMQVPIGTTSQITSYRIDDSGMLARTVGGVTTSTIGRGRTPLWETATSVIAGVPSSITTSFGVDPLGNIHSAIAPSGFTTDPQIGQPVALRRWRTSAYGEPIERYRSVSTGVVSEPVAGSIAAGFGFKGMWRDASGQIKTDNRMYEPSRGNFTSSDPAMADGNWYAWPTDPVNKYDPSGLDWEWIDSSAGGGYWKYMEGTAQIPGPPMGFSGADTGIRRYGIIEHLKYGGYDSLGAADPGSFRMFVGAERDAWWNGQSYAARSKAIEGVIDQIVKDESRARYDLAIQHMNRAVAESVVQTVEMPVQPAFQVHDMAVLSYARGAGIPTGDVHLSSDMGAGARVAVANGETGKFIATQVTVNGLVFLPGGINTAWSYAERYSLAKAEAAALALAAERRALAAFNPENGVPVGVRPVQPLDVGTFGDVSAPGRAIVGDRLTGDHIPSTAAIQASERLAGRQLSRSQARALRDRGNTIVMPEDLHADSRTFKGRNTARTIALDAQDLWAASQRDLDAFYRNAINAGYPRDRVVQAMVELQILNLRAGIVP